MDFCYMQNYELSIKGPPFSHCSNTQFTSRSEFCLHFAKLVLHMKSDILIRSWIIKIWLKVHYNFWNPYGSAKSWDLQAWKWARKWRTPKMRVDQIRIQSRLLFLLIFTHPHKHLYNTSYNLKLYGLKSPLYLYNLVLHFIPQNM